jgi:hypothetical protein
MHFYFDRQHTTHYGGIVMEHNTHNGQGVSALDFVPTHVELQLSPSSEFTRRGLGRKVVRANGRFSPARGDRSYRFVHLPVGEHKLVDQLVREFPGGPWNTTIVFRGGNTGRLPAWAVVQHAPRGTDRAFAHAVGEFDKARQQAIKRGIVRIS